MDSAAAGRLQKLQMADLGTARREYISTREAKRYVAARMEDIEASRMSNVAGSEAQRLAQANQESLSKWSNMYKEIGDADGLEQLDDLMHGQSHRAQLSAKVRESGGQTYSKSERKDDNFLKLARAPALRALQSSGRGGGVVGTRGRRSQSALARRVMILESAMTANPTSSRTSHQGGVTKLGHHVSPDHRSKYRPLDPAVNPDGDSPKRNRGQGQLQGGRGKGKAKIQEQTPRPKRIPPAGNYAQVLSNPDSFLAQARHLLQTRAPSNVFAQTVKVPDTPKQGNGPTTKQSSGISKAASTPKFVPGTPSGTKPGPSSAASTPTPVPSTVYNRGNHPAPKSVTKQSPNVSKSAPTTKLVPGPVSHAKQGGLVSRGSSPAQASSSTPKGLESSRHASPISRPVSKSASAEKRQAKDVAGSHSQQPQPQNSTPQKDEKPHAGTEAPEDVLIDVTTTPSTDEMLSSSLDKMTLMSPGIKELADVDFMQDVKDTPSQKRAIPPPPGLIHTGKASFDDAMAEYMERGPPGLVHPGKINFEKAMAEYEKKESSNMDVENLPEQSSNPLIDGYQREISTLRDVLKTKGFSSGTVQRIEASIKDLETRIQEALKGSPENQASSAENCGQDTAPNVPCTPQNTPVTKGAAAQEKTAMKGRETQPSSQPKPSLGLISPSPLRTAVTAPPFVPGRKSSFTEHRSPQNSISSDSTIFHQPTSTSPDHIFGDHLLPGQRDRQPSTTRFDISSKLSYPSSVPKKGHIGLPQSSILAGVTVSGIKEFTPGAYASIYSPTPKEVPPSLVASVTTPETPKAPTRPRVIGVAPSLSRDAFAPDKAQSASQPPIYAPPIKSQSPATARTSSMHASARTFSSELEKSRYAPENYKPCR